MARVEDGWKTFSFAAPHERAEAIRTVAALYKDNLEASSTPMRTPDEAETVCRRVFKEVGTKGATGYNRNIEPIVSRYRELGKKGAASLIELSVPADADFDFLTFHEEVDDLMGPENAEPKIV